jgi:hypothetical protein
MLEKQSHCFVDGFHLKRPSSFNPSFLSQSPKGRKEKQKES